MRYYSGHIRTLAGEYGKIILRMCRGYTLPGIHHVVFVGGVQRSGTNMVMEILEHSPDAKVFHERDPRAFDNFSLRPDSVIRDLAVSVLPCAIFKALSESYRIAELMSQFRHSSALWVYRHYEPVNASNIALWPGDRNGLDAIVKERTAAGWRGMGMTDDTLAIVRKYYRPDLSVASAQALFWYYRNQLFFDQGLNRNSSVLMVRYEDLLDTPQPEITRMAKFLGIRIAPSVATHVDTPPRKEYGLDIEQPIRELCDSMFARLDVTLENQRRAQQQVHPPAWAPSDQLSANFLHPG